MRSNIVLLCGLCSAVAEFFHEPSKTDFRPTGLGLENSEFGFSMAYQDSDSPALVVGAPEQDFVGKVYTCPLEGLSRDVNCSVVSMADLDIETKTKNARQDFNPDQKYFFGASIAATSDYFLTCAPLMTKTITYRKGGYKKLLKSASVFGACYLYDNKENKYVEWMDNGVKIEDIVAKKHNINPPLELQTIKSGGVGWSTLLEPHGSLLVSKTTLQGDILSVDADKPLEPSKSLLESHWNLHEQNIRIFNDHYNHGFGLAVGKFFNDSGKLYAVSVHHSNLQGSIQFLEKNEESGQFDIYHDKYKLVRTKSFEPYYIESDSFGSMFGYVLAAADITGDGLSELVVGAPAYSHENKYQMEFGAMHIYIGGDLQSRNDKNRMRIILGSQEKGRFGQAIATSDIDGDNIPEIFVSAPYENIGSGTVYVISGYTLSSLLSPEGARYVRVKDLPQTQILRGDATTKLYGYSLQIIEDMDDNGCNELAIGSPESSSVRVLRCLPTVGASISLQLLAEGPDNGRNYTVKEDAKNFKVSVCLKVTVREKCNSVVGSIKVESYVSGSDTKIPDSVFTHDLSAEKEQSTCKIITVNLLKQGPGDYTFSTKIQVLDADKNGDRKEKAYHSWAVLSSQSEVKSSIDVKRACSDEECEPKLTYQMEWIGDVFVDASTSEIKTVVIRGKNSGNSASSTFLRLTVKGARVSQLTKNCLKENATDTYSCQLPPVQRNSDFNVTVLLNTSEPANVQSLEITAQLYDTVFTNLHYEKMYLSIPYLLNSSSVMVEGSNFTLNVTDKDIEDGNIVSFNTNHEYYIINNGTVTWLDLVADLEIKKEPFIQNVKILSSNSCQKQNSTDDIFKFSCLITIKPGAVKMITASIELSKEILEKNITGVNLFTTSELTLPLQPTKKTLLLTLSTFIQYEQILTLGNSKLLISLLVIAIALLLLLLATFVLYKTGFFKRKEKKKLDVLRESVRKRSIRMNSESSRSHKPSTVDENHCEIEVVDDCVFSDIALQEQECPQTSTDDVMLIKEAEVNHSS